MYIYSSLVIFTVSIYGMISDRHTRAWTTIRSRSSSNRDQSLDQRAQDSISTGDSRT